MWCETWVSTHELSEYAPVYRQLLSFLCSYLMSSDVISIENWQAGWLISWMGSLNISKWKTQCQSDSITSLPTGKGTSILILVWEYKVWLNLLHVNNSAVWLGNCTLKKGLLFTSATFCLAYFVTNLESAVIQQLAAVFFYYQNMP